MTPGTEHDYLVGLRQILEGSFNESELRTLCFDLHIDYDSLPGQSKGDKARELVAYLHRRGRIPELVRVGRQSRPDVHWGGTRAISEEASPERRSRTLGETPVGYASGQKQQATPFLVFSLSVPLSILYIAYLWLTRTSLGAAAIGYVALGLAFGLLQTVIHVQRPYRVAFWSTILGPCVAYLFFAVLGPLWALGIIGGPGMPVSGGTIPIESLPYTQRLGLAGGLLVFAGVVSVLTIPFGFIGVAGRFLGGQLSQIKAMPDAASLEPPQATKRGLFRIITAAAASTAVSLLVALIDRTWN
jgi:hypothetical protein